MWERLFDRAIASAHHPWALWVLVACSAAESALLPLPIDLLFVPLVLAARDRAWPFTLAATAASVAGGLAGYLIGAFLFHAIGEPILGFYGMLDRFHEIAAEYRVNGAWIVFLAGISPIPYKVVAIASGALDMSIATFVLMSVLSRGIRFAAIAGLMWWIGPPAYRFMKRNAALSAAVGLAGLVLSLLLVRYAF